MLSAAGKHYFVSCKRLKNISLFIDKPSLPVVSFRSRIAACSMTDVLTDTTQLIRSRMFVELEQYCVFH